MEIDVFDFYSKVLVPLTPSPIVTKLLQIVMGGGETSEDFAQLLGHDPELQHWVRLTVQRLGFERRASKLIQMVILLGQNRVRELILGRQIERNYVKPEEQILAKMLKEKEKAQANVKTPAAPAAAAAKEKTDKGAVPAAVQEAEEVIPTISDFQKYLVYANRAEETAISIRNSYPGQAFAGGVIFDYVSGFLGAQEFPKLEDSRIKNPQVYLEEIFKDGIRAAMAANEIVQKISIPHQKNVFVTALVHNIGKALLLAYDPKGFERAFVASTGEKDVKRKLSSVEAEFLEFDFDHAQMGSLYLGRLPFLAEIERSIDYHHAPHLLKFSNPKLYALAAVLSVSANLVKIYQRSRAESPDTDKIRDGSLKKSEDFKFLKLTDEDWSEIKANYALKLMKVGY